MNALTILVIGPLEVYVHDIYRHNYVKIAKWVLCNELR